VPFIETAEDLANFLADQLGIYEDDRCLKKQKILKTDPTNKLSPHLIHLENCTCRIFWVLDMTIRIRQAVHNEEGLRKLKENIP